MHAAPLLLLIAATLLPGVGGSDPRRPVDPDRQPWRALGRVQTELGGRCTGFLVGPSTVLTAAHCLFRASTGRFVQPRSVHFLLGYERGRFAAHARALSFRTGPGWDGTARGVAASDWAVLTLDAPLGTPDRVLARRGPPAPQAAAMLGGYGADRAELIEADQACAVLGTAMDAAGDQLILHGCAGTRGTSGAPLLVRDGAGWAAAGIQVAAVAGRSRGVAVPLPALSELQ